MLIGGNLSCDAAGALDVAELRVTASGDMRVWGGVTLSRGETPPLPVSTLVVDGLLLLDAAGSGNRSVVRALDVAVGGRFFAGALDVGDRWTTLTVRANALFNFTPLATFTVQRSLLLGRVLVVGALAAGAHYEGVRLEVGAGGKLDVPDCVVDDGACRPALIRMEQDVVVSGVIRVHSLTLEANQLVVGASGLIDVSGGGYASQLGPGRWRLLQAVGRTAGVRLSRVC